MVLHQVSNGAAMMSALVRGMMSVLTSVSTGSLAWSMIGWLALALMMTSTAVHARVATASAAASLHEVTMGWQGVAGVSHYDLQIRAADTQTAPWQTVAVTQDTQYLVSGLAEGDYQLRVGSCVEEPGVTIHCGEHISDYSAPYSLTLPFASALPAPVVELANSPTLTPLSAFPVDYDVASSQVATMAGVVSTAQ